MLLMRLLLSLMVVRVALMRRVRDEILLFCRYLNIEGLRTTMEEDTNKDYKSSRWSQFCRISCGTSVKLLSSKFLERCLEILWKIQSMFTPIEYSISSVCQRRTGLEIY